MPKKKGDQQHIATPITYQKKNNKMKVQIDLKIKESAQTAKIQTILAIKMP